MSNVLATGLAAKVRRTIRDMTDDDSIVDAIDVPFDGTDIGIDAINVQEALSQVRTQAQIYQFLIIGNATDTEYTITHNLHTTKLNLALYTSNGLLVYTTLKKIDLDTVKVFFGHPQVGQDYILQISR